MIHFQKNDYQMTKNAKNIPPMRLWTAFNQPTKISSIKNVTQVFQFSLSLLNKNLSNTLFSREDKKVFSQILYREKILELLESARFV